MCYLRHSLAACLAGLRHRPTRPPPPRAPAPRQLFISAAASTTCAHVALVHHISKLTCAEPSSQLQKHSIQCPLAPCSHHIVIATSTATTCTTPHPQQTAACHYHCCSHPTPTGNTMQGLRPMPTIPQWPACACSNTFMARPSAAPGLRDVAMPWSKLLLCRCGHICWIRALNHVSGSQPSPKMTFGR